VQVRQPTASGIESIDPPSFLQIIFYSLFWCRSLLSTCTKPSSPDCSRIKERGAASDGESKARKKKKQVSWGLKSLYERHEITLVSVIS